jgi:chromosome segregation ATPase
VFARFDALDARMDRVEARLDDMDARLQRLEQKSYDTKPIWERALAEILSVGEKVDTIDRKLNVMNRDMLALRAEQVRLEDRMDKIESKPVQ